MEQIKREPRKQCSQCKDWKPVSEFHKEKAKPLGLQSRCKFCKKIEGEERRKQKQEVVEIRQSYENL